MESLTAFVQKRETKDGDQMLKARTRTLVSLAICGFGATGAAQAASDTPVKLLVGFSAGGGVDTAARLVAQEISSTLDRPVIVENRPGASSMIAADAVARSAPDGNTLLFAGTAMITAPLAVGESSYHPVESFSPVAGVSRSGLTLAVPIESELQSVSDLITEARAKPGEVSYASTGVGSLHHLAMERLSQEAGLDLLHVPYKGGSRAANDLAAGMVDSGVSSLAAVKPHLEAERVRLIAMLSGDRDPTIPELPVVAETVDGVDVVSALFVLAPADTPIEIREEISQAIETALNSERLQRGLNAQYAWPAYLGTDDLGAWIQQEYDLWQQVVSSANLSE